MMATANVGASYAITAVEPVENAADSTRVIEYSKLPPAAQASFDVAQSNATAVAPVWESKDPEAVRSILTHTYVRKDGQLFQYEVIHGDHPAPGIFQVVLFGLFGIDGFVLVGYGLDKWYGLSEPR
ncbi:hypothetical protein [Haloferax sp. DFSO52]|uniref:hypothetical protein n=1 Tax=Haloferax sp. DFSO52 TaxID=3388505 RepID=UPI003A837587